MGKRLDKAIILAVNAHKNQLDKANDDYILHLIRVMIQLNTEEERIIGVLHDVIEDTYITYDDLKNEGFSEKIINILKILTKDNQEEYFDYIERIKLNDIAIKVKLADLKDNMNINRIKNPTKKDFFRIEKYKKAIEILMN